MITTFCQEKAGKIIAAVFNSYHFSRRANSSIHLIFTLQSSFIKENRGDKRGENHEQKFVERIWIFQETAEISLQFCHNEGTQEGKR